MISYEVSLGLIIMPILLFSGTANLSGIVLLQEYIFFFIPLWPSFILFFISILAETNRLPFDLPEAESELVSGFMTEHAAVIFVFFFLAEYASIVLMCILTSILFIGGYLFIDYTQIFTILDQILFNLFFIDSIYLLQSYLENIYYNYIIEGIYYALCLGLKSSIMIFIFIWARASFPRIRFDQLMAFCWTVLLPIIFALIILVPCILYSYNIFPANINLF